MCGYHWNNLTIILLVKVIPIYYRWLEYSKIGARIQDTGIVAFKTPLKEVSILFSLNFRFICMVVQC